MCACSCLCIRACVCVCVCVLVRSFLALMRDTCCICCVSTLKLHLSVRGEQLYSEGLSFFLVLTPRTSHFERLHPVGASRWCSFSVHGAIIYVCRDPFKTYTHHLILNGFNQSKRKQISHMHIYNYSCQKCHN